MSSFAQAIRQNFNGQLSKRVDRTMDALSTFRLFAADPQRTQERISEQPQNAREIEYYSENISNIKTIDDFMNDQRIYGFVMHAYGLDDLSYAKAFMRKILEGGPDDPEALANQLTDPRYLALAEDFNFTEFGTTTTTFGRVQTGVIDKYIQQSVEIEAGGQNNGARLALYFQRKVDEVDSAFSILGDSALLQVVQTAFGLPVQMSFSTIEKQAELIDQRLDIEDLSDPEFLEGMLNQFLARWDIDNPSSVNVPPLIAAPLGVQSISLDLLTSLQSLKFRQ